MIELPISPAGHKYGWIPTPRLPNELGIASVPGLKLENPPAHDYHLAEFMQSVKDQTTLGGCTAFAGAADREALAAQYQHKIVTLAPLFLYYIERKINGSLDQGDAGSDGQTSCMALAEVGICTESNDPYVPANFQIPPTEAQIAEAANWKAGAHHSLFSVQDVKLCINSGYRVRIGMSVFESFENDISSNGLMRVPNTKTEALLGGHEILIYAYDNSIKCPGAHSSGAVLVRNSWGASWGLKGDFWMAQELLVADSVVGPDLKMQHLGSAWKA